VLPLVMWSECFAHARGGAGWSSVGGGRRAGAARLRAPPRPAGRRRQALLATLCRRCPWPRWAGNAGGRRGVGATHGTPTARPGAPGWPAARRARPGQPRPAGRRGAPLPRGPPPPVAGAGGPGREGDGERRDRCCWPARCAASALPSWPPQLCVEQFYLICATRLSIGFMHFMQNICRIGKNMQNNTQNMSKNLQNMQDAMQNISQNMRNMNTICRICRICIDICRISNIYKVIYRI
jgi:hypothetical protein